GMDGHKDSIAIPVLPEGAKAPTRLDRPPNDLPKLRKWIERVLRDGEIRACYEASGAGYVLHRAIHEWGYTCDVIPPSLIPKRSGVHRKHDKRDAADLARLHRAGELVTVRTPSEASHISAEVLRFRHQVFIQYRHSSCASGARLSSSLYTRHEGINASISSRNRSV